MMADGFEISCYFCILIGLCCPIWSAHGYRSTRNYANFPSVEIRYDVFLTFSIIIWCICSITFPLLLYWHLTTSHLPISDPSQFKFRLILYSLKLFGVVNILIVKICKLYYSIIRLIDHEKWFCCHIIDKYWLHSIIIINHDLFGRASNLLLFSSLYCCFCIMIISFCSIFSSHSKALLIEHLSLCILEFIPIIFLCKVYKDIVHNEPYFVDDFFLLKEIFCLILIHILFIISPPIIAINIFEEYDIVLMIDMISHTISCSLFIIISLKIGVWAAMNRQNIIKQEKDSLNVYKNANGMPFVLHCILSSRSNTVHVFR